MTLEARLEELELRLDAIEAEKLSYVTRLSKAQLGALLKRLPEDSQPELFDCTRLVEIEHDGCRYVSARCATP